MHTPNRRDGKLNHLLTAYSVSNTCTKNYCNSTVTVGGLVAIYRLPRSESEGVDDLGGFGVDDPSSDESDPSGA